MTTKVIRNITDAEVICIGAFTLDTAVYLDIQKMKLRPQSVRQLDIEINDVIVFWVGEPFFRIIRHVVSPMCDR
jgi:hypothetical protein